MVPFFLEDGGVGGENHKKWRAEREEKKMEGSREGGRKHNPLGEARESIVWKSSGNILYVCYPMSGSVCLFKERKKNVLVCPISSILDLASLRPKGGFAPDVSLYTSISTRVYLIQYNECHWID